MLIKKPGFLNNSVSFLSTRVSFQAAEFSRNLLELETVQGQLTAQVVGWPVCQIIIWFWAEYLSNYYLVDIAVLCRILVKLLIGWYRSFEQIFCQNYYLVDIAVLRRLSMFSFAAGEQPSLAECHQREVSKTRIETNLIWWNLPLEVHWSKHRLVVVVSNHPEIRRRLYLDADIIWEDINRKKTFSFLIWWNLSLGSPLMIKPLVVVAYNSLVGRKLISMQISDGEDIHRGFWLFCWQ